MSAQTRPSALAGGVARGEARTSYGPTARAVTLQGARDFLVASLEALSHLYANRGEQMPDLPTWKLLTEALVMASGYE